MNTTTLDGVRKMLKSERTKQWERVLETQIGQLSLPIPHREFQFHPERKFRADFAWPSHMLIVEIGYRYLRFTPAQVESGYAVSIIERMLECNS
jgi:hypothetical protein